MTTDPLRFGIIGFGRFAEKAIAPAIRATAGARLTAIQKRSLGEATRKAKEFGIPLAFASVEELVRHPDVDAVFIASANSAHHGEAVAAACAGKHVLLEKPMAVTVAEAEDIIAACHSADVRLMVGHMVRLSPAVRRVRDLVAAGTLGTVTYARADFVYDGRLSHRPWLVDRRVAGGGPLYDIGVHCLDTLRCVLGREVLAARAVLEPEPTEAETERTAQVALRFEGGVVGSVYCSFDSPIRKSILEVVGTDAIVSLSDFTMSGRKAEVMVSRGSGDRPASTSREVVTIPDLYVEEIEQFLRSVRGGIEPELSGNNGLRNQRILEGVVGGNAVVTG